MPPVIQAVALAATAIGTSAAAAGTGLVAAFSTGGALASGTLLGSLARVAIGMTLGAIARALQKKPDLKVSSGQRVSLTVGENNPLAFILGRSATPGELLYHNSWDPGGNETPYEYYVQVIQISDLPQKLLRIYVNGEYPIIKDNELIYHDNVVGKAVEGYEVKGKDTLWIKFYDGTQTVADPYLLDVFNEGDRAWQSDMIGLGMSYAIITHRLSREFSQRLDFKFEVQSWGLYDRRKDSTAGGSGAQRWNDWRTWKPSQNPIVIIDNILRGIKDPINGRFLWGGQKISNYNLPASQWFAAMNICDVIRTDTQEPTYRAGMEVVVSDEPASVIEEYLKACLGKICEIAGKFYINAGGPTASVYSFTDDQIIITKPEDFNPIRVFADTYNGISATYLEPENGWNSKEAPVRLNSTYLQEDHNVSNIAGLTYAAVPYSNQIQRLMATALKDSRKQRVHVLSLFPDARPITPLDYITYTSRRNGYTNKVFSVEGVQWAPSGDTGLIIREEDPNDYDYDSQEDNLPHQVGWVKKPPIITREADFRVEAQSIKDSEGNGRHPCIGLYWTPKDNVTAIRYRVRLASTHEQVQVDGALPNVQGSAESLVLTANGAPVTANGQQITYNVFTNVSEGYAQITSRGFIAGETYEVNAMYEPVAGHRWLTTWLSVTLLNIKLGEKDLESTIIDKVDTAKENSDWAAAQVVLIQDLVNDLVASSEAFSAETLGRIEDIQAALAGLDTGTVQEILGIAVAGIRKGWGADPAFASWTATALDYWTGVGVDTYGVKDTGGLYKSSLKVDVPSGTSQCIVTASSLVAGQLPGADPVEPYVVVWALLKYISGNLNGYLAPEWRNPATNLWTRGDAFGLTSPVGRLIQDWGFVNETNRFQSKGVIWRRPTAFIPDAVRLVLTIKPSSSSSAISARFDYIDLGTPTEAEVKGYTANSYTDSAIEAYNYSITSPTGAIAATVNTILAGFNVNLGSVTETVLALVNADIATAAKISNIETTFGGANYVRNGQFRTGLVEAGQDPSYWKLFGANGWKVEAKNTRNTIPASINSPTAYYGVTPASTSLTEAQASEGECRAGNRYRVGIYMATETPVTFLAGIRVQWFNAAGTSLGNSSVIVTVNSTTWKKFSDFGLAAEADLVTAPANAVTYKLFVRKEPSTAAKPLYFTTVDMFALDEVSYAKASTAAATASSASASVATLQSQAAASFGSYSAMITTLATAVAKVNKASSTYVIRAIAEGGSSALKLVAWDDETGSGGAVVVEGDDVIAPGTLSTGTLVVTDLGHNKVPDDQLQSSRQWARNDTAWELFPDLNSGFKSLGEVRWTKANTNGVATAAYTGRKFPVYPGQRLVGKYEVIRGTAGNMRCYARLNFRGKDGSLVSTPHLGVIDNSAGGIQSSQRQIVVPDGAYTAEWSWIVDTAATTTSWVRFASPECISNEDASVLITPDGAFFNQLSAQTAWIKTANIVNANIVRLHLEEGATFSGATGFLSGNRTLTDDTWTTLATVTIAKEANKAVNIQTYINMVQRATYTIVIAPGDPFPTFGTGYGPLSYRVLRNGALLKTLIEANMWWVDVSSLSGTVTYQLQIFTESLGPNKNQSAIVQSGAALSVLQVVK